MAEFDATKYANDYIKQTYDRINLTTEKGKKSQWTEKAKAAGLSLNAYITRAVDNYAGISGLVTVCRAALHDSFRF